MWNPWAKAKEEQERADKLEIIVLRMAEEEDQRKEAEAEANAEAQAIIDEEDRLERLAKEENERKNAAKELATKNKESYITITEISTNGNNITEGNFEFDWNIYFIEELQKNGYVGVSDEDTVEQWFRDICKHVVLETYEQSDSDLGEPNMEELGDGRRSYS